MSAVVHSKVVPQNWEERKSLELEIFILACPEAVVALDKTANTASRLSRLKKKIYVRLFDRVR